MSFESRDYYVWHIFNNVDYLTQSNPLRLDPFLAA